ncbi:MAG: glutamate--tRNA ligase, partial [Thermoplasmata archaeon]|nr:glutamate--tRNA ligase [Thermoplasmata archaeon]
SKRKLKPLVEKKLVWGWDDPRLPTLRGLARRGILAEAIKEFVLSQGISKSESVIAFENLEAVNRKLLDGRAKRLFFVPQPVKLIVENAPEKEAVLKYHPSMDMGVRKIKTGGIFYIPQDDAVMLKEGSKFRLKDLYNVVVKEKGSIIKGEFAGEKLLPIPKIQWVSDEKYEMNVIVPMLPFKNGEFDRNSLKIVKGFVEKNIEEIKHGEIVQFERFGFVRIEKNGGIRGIRAHA